MHPATLFLNSLPHMFALNLSVATLSACLNSQHKTQNSCPQAKVHQKALLAAGLVEGPTDPRLPTLRGLLRAGCHPDALKAFLLEQVCWL